jgi:hypothetical protein
MQAAFFAGEFTDEAKCKINAEHEYYWLPVAEAEKACFHACHTWAIRQGRRPRLNSNDRARIPATQLPVGDLVSCWE